MNSLLAVLIVLVTIPHLTGTPRIPDYIYYGSFGTALILLILRGRKMTFRVAYIPFVLSILLSIWVNDIPSIFQVPIRAIAFCMMAFTVGPFINNMPLQIFRHKLLIYVLTFIRWIVILSFIGYLLGLSSMYNRFGFCGFTNHSMILGPLSGIAVLNYFYWIYLSSNLKSRLFNTFFMSISFLTLILTGSRSALGACVVGLLFFIFTIYRKKLLYIFRFFVVSALILAATSSIWWPYTEHLRNKMEYGEEMGSSTASRDLLWADRMNEFQTYPLFGVGFASYNLDISKNKGNEVTGTIEPGSSWLFLLSSMGLMGFLSFLLPPLYMLFKAFTLRTDLLNNAFLGSLLILFLAHMFFEGYVVASGAYLCFLLWLLLSECYYCLIKLKNRNGIDTNGCKTAL